MDATKLEEMANLVANIVQTRLCEKRMTKAYMSDIERQEQLRSDLIALSEKYSVEKEVIAKARAVIAEHGFALFDVGGDGGSELKPEVQRLKPPDFGPHGPSDEDIKKEIEEILKKFNMLRDPQPYEYIYEPKLPWNREVDIGLFVSILMELLRLILKLNKRLDLLPKSGSGKLTNLPKPVEGWQVGKPRADGKVPYSNKKSGEVWLWDTKNQRWIPPKDHPDPNPITPEGKRLAGEGTM